MGDSCAQRPDQRKPQLTGQRNGATVEQELEAIGPDRRFGQVVEFVEFLDLFERERRSMHPGLVVALEFDDRVFGGAGFELSGRLGGIATELWIHGRDGKRIGRLIGVEEAGEFRCQRLEKSRILLG